MYDCRIQYQNVFVGGDAEQLLASPKTEEKY